MNNKDMAIKVLVVIWLFGSIVGMLTTKWIQDCKEYEHPVSQCIGGIVCSLGMSWVYVALIYDNNNFQIPQWLWHHCPTNEEITYDEEYVYDDDGNIIEHHTFQNSKCGVCGKVHRKQLQ